MAKNRSNREGPWLSQPAGGTLITKNPNGSTRVSGVATLEHADGPLTGTTDRDNIGVSTKPPPRS